MRSFHKYEDADRDMGKWVFTMAIADTMLDYRSPVDVDR